MFGSAGPVADARAIELLAKRGALPKIAVIVIHPRQFGRNGTSDEWTSYVAAQNPTAEVEKTPPTPLTGRFAQRYANAAELVAELRSSGSLVDSSRDHSKSSKDLLGIPPSFAAHVAPLAGALKAFDPSNLYLVTPPLTPGATKEDRDKAASTVATMLGIPRANILMTSVSRPLDQFATYTHLNERGRELFTQELSRAIVARLASRL
jgi:hypothetical protein